MPPLPVRLRAQACRRRAKARPTAYRGCGIEPWPARADTTRVQRGDVWRGARRAHGVTWRSGRSLSLLAVLTASLGLTGCGSASTSNRFVV
jgi:hypothetical protein